MQFKKDDSADFSAKSNRQRKESASILANVAEQKVAAAKAAAPKTVKVKNPKSVKRRSKLFQENFSKTRSQRALEETVDNTNIKNLRNADISKLPATLAAYAGNPERRLIRSNTGGVNDGALKMAVSEGLSGIGNLGYLEGATGARGVLNKVVGRTTTGKVARTLGLLGAVGVGKAALSKRKERF